MNLKIQKKKKDFSLKEKHLQNVNIYYFIYYIIIIVKKIEERNNYNKEIKNKEISKKNYRERKNYISSLDRYMAKQKEESMIREEKAFKKYQGYVS